MNFQKNGQGIEVIRAGQGLAPLPFVDGLRSFKTEEVL